MFSLTTLPTLLAFLEQTRFVFSTCATDVAAVTIGTDVTTIAANAYKDCTTITTLVIASTVTFICIYTIIIIPTIYILNKNFNKNNKNNKNQNPGNQMILFFCFYNNCNILFYFR
jgi:hypothetical protein